MPVLALDEASGYVAAPGTGLANLRARLAAFYGPQARLELRENTPRGMVAEIVFPVAGDSPTEGPS